jgi:Protein of unknown function (DUF2459)
MNRGLRRHSRSLVLLAALILASIPSFGQPSQGSTEASAARTEVIYVVRRGWHIDIGFAAAALRPPLQSLSTNFPGVRYLFFGFGDRRYLLAKDRHVPVLLAALWPGRGLILATALKSSPQDAFGASEVVALAVTVRQAEEAQAFILRSMDAVEPYANGPYEDSLYFTATPRYSAFHTCNTWVAEALKAAPLPIRSTGVVFAGQLWGQVRRLQRKQSAVQLQGGFVPS